MLHQPNALAIIALSAGILISCAGWRPAAPHRVAAAEGAGASADDGPPLAAEHHRRRS
jgi:hypothetical protein